MKHHHIDFFHTPNQNIYGFTSIFFDSPKSNFTQKTKKNPVTNDLKLVTNPSSTNINKNYKILEQENHSSQEEETSNTATIKEIKETKTTAPVDNN